LGKEVFEFAVFEFLGANTQAPLQAMTYITQKGNDVTLLVHVQPNAKRSEVAGMHGGRLKIRLAAPPADGKANAELIGFLSKYAGVPKRDIEIVRGETSRQKTVVIRNCMKNLTFGP
jgi:uncharacterized protein (TIGR00251 family)